MTFARSACSTVVSGLRAEDEVISRNHWQKTYTSFSTGRVSGSGSWGCIVRGSRVSKVRQRTNDCDNPPECLDSYMPLYHNLAYKRCSVAL